MKEQSLKNIIAQGETITVEFKSWIKANSMKDRINLVVPELIAFANSKGGTVYLVQHCVNINEYSSFLFAIIGA